jgi:hypothetical protein
MKKKPKGTISATEALLKYSKSRPNNPFKDAYDGIDAMAALERRKKKDQKFSVKYAKVGKEKTRKLDNKTKKRLADEALSFVKSEHDKILKDVSFCLTGNGVTKCGTIRSYIECMRMILGNALEVRERLGLNELDVRFVKCSDCTGFVELSFPKGNEVDAGELRRVLSMMLYRTHDSYDCRRSHGEIAGCYMTLDVVQEGEKVLFRYKNA